MQMRICFSVVTTILLFIGLTPVFAAPPRTISYQGYLKDGSGVPVTAAAKPMGFALYSTASGTTPLWNENQDVKVDKGIYSVELGTVAPLNIPSDARYYLGITIPPDNEMTPRTALTGTIYAFRAGCNPGDMITCYTGPSGTLNVGVCKSGTRTCASDGSSFGPCTGEIIPSQEICYNLVDEDCDGKTDNGCTPPRFCEPGTSVACYSGPPGTQNIGSCHAGTKICTTDGSAYSPCVGEQGPSVEVCDGMDNNCNGVVDEGISYTTVSNGQYVCNNGATLLLCNTGFASCISSGACDTTITNDTQNCGGCGNICPAVANGSPGCNNSSCTIAACNTGFGNCDGNMSNGCEVNLMSTAAHCSACGNPCGVNESCQNGACIKPIGSVCITNSQCSSGFCVDGICCNTACSGTCQACSSAKTGGASGTCSNLPNGTDPDNECADQGAASCGTSGTCNGAGACAYYPAGTQSASVSCTGSTLTLASTCNGMGSSTSGGTVSCAPYSCASGSACGNTCSSDPGCASGFYCNSNVCSAKLSPGSACTSANQCMSGTCSGIVCL